MSSRTVELEDVGSGSESRREHHGRTFSSPAGEEDFVLPGCSPVLAEGEGLVAEQLTGLAPPNQRGLPQVLATDEWNCQTGFLVLLD